MYLITQYGADLMPAQTHYIDSIYYDLELTANVIKTMGAQIFEKMGIELTPVEHAALDTISCNKGICQRDLAKLIFKDRANTGRILDSLEEKKLIKRYIDTKNNRLVRKLDLTEKGRRKLNNIRNKIEETLKTISISISDDEISKIQNSLKSLRNAVLEIVNVKI